MYIHVYVYVYIYINISIYLSSPLVGNDFLLSAGAMPRNGWSTVPLNRHTVPSSMHTYIYI